MGNAYKQLYYYVPGSVLVAVGLVILLTWSTTLSNFLLGVLLAGNGLLLCFLAHWGKQSNRVRNLTQGQLQCYIPGIVVSVVALLTLFLWEVTLPNFLLGVFLACAGSVLCFLAYWEGRVHKKGNVVPTIGDVNASHRTIHVQSGNYTESVQGDFINIQGNQIYINQDLSQFVEQIKEVVLQLQNHGYTRQAAEQEITNDLRRSASSNEKFQRNLSRWQKSVSDYNDESFKSADAIEALIKLAFENSSYKAVEPIPKLEDRYKRLNDLLENGSWEEADGETASIIIDLMPKPVRSHTYRNITLYEIEADEISPGVLRKLDHLWNKYSNGRFGFSVQKGIWKQIVKDYQSRNTWEYEDDEPYLKFIDTVGWTRDDDRIYHIDLNYSLWAERGHLPAKLMFAFRFYSPPSNYCYFNTEVFDTTMRCKYPDNPLIPFWLQQWLEGGE